MATPESRQISNAPEPAPFTHGELWREILFKDIPWLLGAKGGHRGMVWFVLAVLEISAVLCADPVQWTLGRLETAATPRESMHTEKPQAMELIITSGETQSPAVVKVKLPAQDNEKELGKEFLLFLLGLPPAFLIWMWRNADKREELKNQAITNNQTNFHKLVEWLNGENEDFAAAAIPHLNRFLIQPEFSGEFSESVWRAFRAKLESWAKKEKIINLLDQIDQWQRLPALKQKETARPSLDIPPSISALHQIVFEILKAPTSFDFVSIQLPRISLFSEQFPANTTMMFANLRWAILARSSFEKGRFSYCDLRGANLDSGNFSGALFYNANMKGAWLGSANLENAKFGKSNLSYANLNYSNLRGANLKKANLFKANLLEANLTEADLRESDMKRVYLEKANLESANLESAKMDGAILAFANLEGARASGVRLVRANLRGAKLGWVQMYYADLRGADLSKAEMIRPELNIPRLGPNNLAKAALLGAKYDEKTIFPEGFDPVAAGMVKVE